MNEKIAQQRLSVHDVKNAKKYNMLPIIHSAYRHMLPGDEQWLKYAYMLSLYSGDIAYQLALYFKPQELSQSVSEISTQPQQLLFQQSDLYTAPEGLTLLENNKRLKQYQYWLQYAVDLTYQPAVKPLALLLIHQHEYAKAQELLKPYYQQSELLKLAFIIALNSGDTTMLNSLKDKVSKNAELSDFYHQMKLYSVLDNAIDYSHNESIDSFIDKAIDKRIDHTKKRYLTSPNISNKLCSDNRSVQPYASNLHDLKIVEQLIIQAAEHPLSQHFCFLPVQYIPLSDLKCAHPKRLSKPFGSSIALPRGNQKSSAIQCDETHWPTVMKASLSTYKMVLLPYGGANVHGKIMYLDRYDTVDVLIHELSHFLGFVDEYPLVSHHVFCQSNTSEKALNVVLLPKYWIGEQVKVREQIMNQLPWRHAIDKQTPIITLLNIEALSPEQRLEIPRQILDEVKGKNKLWLLGTPTTEHFFSVDNASVINTSVDNARVEHPIAHDAKVGVYPALTCANNRDIKIKGMPLQSIKPLYHRTTLEYYEVPFPALYLDLIQSGE